MCLFKGRKFGTFDYDPPGSLESLDFFSKMLSETVRVPRWCKIFPKSSSLCVGCNNVTDGQTDRRTDRRQTDGRTDGRTAHAIWRMKRSNFRLKTLQLFVYGLKCVKAKPVPVRFPKSIAALVSTWCDFRTSFGVEPDKDAEGVMAYVNVEFV